MGLSQGGREGRAAEMGLQQEAKEARGWEHRTRGQTPASGKAGMQEAERGQEPVASPVAPLEQERSRYGLSSQITPGLPWPRVWLGNFFGAAWGSLGGAKGQQVIEGTRPLPHSLPAAAGPGRSFPG